MNLRGPKGRRTWRRHPGKECGDLWVPANLDNWAYRRNLLVWWIPLALNLLFRFHFPWLDNALLFALAFMDCQFQWEISFQQITRQKLVQSYWFQRQTPMNSQFLPKFPHCHSEPVDEPSKMPQINGAKPQWRSEQNISTNKIKLAN